MANTTAPSEASASLNKIGHEPPERFPPRLERLEAQIVAVEAHKIEGHQRGLCAAALGRERAEVAAPVLPQDHRLAVDERLVCREARAPPRRSSGSER